MSVSTDGEICFGVICDEDTEFPWDTEEFFDGDIDEWWIYGILGFRHSFEMFDDQGEWIGGKEWPKDDVDRYYEEARQFAKDNPLLPVERVNYCSDAYPMYILAVPGIGYLAKRGYPEQFSPSDLVVTEKQKAALIAFCHTHNIKFTGEPAWYLSSYWG